MRILLSTYGSRGDVEPMAALGAALQACGVATRLSAPPDQEFMDVAARAGVPFVPAFASVHEWIAQARRAAMTLPIMATEMIGAQHRALAIAAQGCDAIVATGLFPSVAAAQAVAETMAIPFFWVAFCPFILPSPDHPPMEYPGQPHPAGMTDNCALWDFNIGAMQALFGEAVNGHRAAIGLSRLDNVRDHVFTRRPLLASDPALVAWLPTEMIQPTQTGAWILPDTRPLGPDLQAFLAAGEAPVYVGFGSTAMMAAPDAARIAIEAVRAQDRRMVLARGWAGLAVIDQDRDCFALGDVNHQALFPHVAAVMHHGGAGTTTAAARAGVPQLIVPQVADQPYWARRIATLGIGAAHDGAVPGVATLSAGLAVALSVETCARAAAFADMVCSDGAAIAASAIIEAITGQR